MKPIEAVKLLLPLNECSIFGSKFSPFRASLGAINPERIGGAKFPYYSILNKDGNLAPPILSGFIAPKLALRDEEILLLTEIFYLGKGM
jgi:hypothetical protein